ncbi:MAG: pyruvate, water dikinase regulatory protein [Anaerosomatales bacterium]|nr:pyruvate, water dikinase regulatory protein [Anaerosomatales bacterium]
MPEPKTIYIVSDGIGETAHQVAKAALGQFAQGAFRVVRLPKITTKAQLAEAVEESCHEGCVFLYTLANPALRAEMERLVTEQGLAAVDVLGPVVAQLAETAETEPLGVAGTMRRIDRSYFERVAAMEYTVHHDDGRGLATLDEADIVLLGVSRSSKTPLSMYLASKGFKVANVPLVYGVEPPAEIFELDPKRCFGLVIDAETLAEIRSRRMTGLGGYTKRYAERETVERELEWARGVMRQIGCVVVRTENRAMEETAEEILRYVRM